MARSRGRTKAGEVLARAKGAPVPDPLETTALVRLTARFQELKRQLYRDAVDTAVELGDILREGKAVLTGHYRRWIERLGISPKTALNYERLSRLAEEAPRILQQFKELGPAKLYRVADIEKTHRNKILNPKRAGRLIEMNHREFASLTAPYRKRRRAVTADMKAHGLKMKIRSWKETLRSARVRGIKSPELKGSLKSELADLVALAERTRKGL
ncbi:MAG: hypothetical protein ACYTHM_14295 [Planctomycetota bacterium]|jgi:hypothetical protein